MLKLNYPGIFSGYSMHNHTSWSDGADSPEEMCRFGKESGLTVLGISDHWVVHPEGTPVSWSLDLHKLDQYVNILQKLQKELNDENFTLKIGLEVDFFFENIDAVLENLRHYPLDYLIGSVHFAGNFSIDSTIEDWYPLSEERKDEICQLYWEKIAGAAAVKEFDFIGHLDLPKKFGLIDNEKYFPHAVKVLDILHQNSGAIELNTAGYFKECKEVYPSLNILQAAQQRKIPVIINADAHSKMHLQRYFTEAKELLQRALYERLCSR